MTPTSRLAQNLKFLRLAANLTQEQMAEVAEMDLVFYRTLEAGRKPRIRVDTVERLAKPFRLEVWQILAPPSVLSRVKIKHPKPQKAAIRGPRAKWKGIRSRR